MYLNIINRLRTFVVETEFRAAARSAPCRRIAGAMGIPPRGAVHCAAYSKEWASCCPAWACNRDGLRIYPASYTFVKILYANVYIHFISGQFQRWNPANLYKQLVERLVCTLYSCRCRSNAWKVASILSVTTRAQE